MDLAQDSCSLGAAHDSGRPRLDDASKQIRLLHFVAVPAEGQDVFKVEMSVASLKGDIKYDALSYAWGDPTPRHSVSVNGTRLPIAQNLYEALSALGRPGVIDLPLWVDALCIDQSNLEERAEQVAMMGIVYQRAAHVRVWLGLPGTYTQKTLQALFSNDVNTLRDMLHTLNTTHDVAVGLHDLLERPWWARLWVLQEIREGSTAIAHCGEFTVDWLELANLGSFVRAVIPWSTEPLADALRGLAYSTPFDRETKSLRNVWGYYVRVAHHIPLETIDILRLCASFECRDSRDKIYGLLGLLREDLRIVADYSSTIEAVYQRATVEVIRRERDLDVLALAGSYRRKDLRLPSWTPDFSNLNTLDEREVRPELQCNASMGLAFDVKFLGLHSLRIRALQVDVCSKRSGSVRHGILPDWALPERCHETLFKWRHMALQASAGQSPDAMIKRFWAMIIDDMFAIDIESRIMLCESWLSNWPLERKTDSLPSFLGHDTQTLWLWLNYVTFFITASGRLGFAPRNSISAGDPLVVIAGCSRPAFLRRTGGASHRLLTTCKCEGMMFGDAVRGPAESLDDLLATGVLPNQVDLAECRGHVAMSRESEHVFVLTMAERHSLPEILEMCRPKMPSDDMVETLQPGFDVDIGSEDLKKDQLRLIIKRRYKAHLFDDDQMTESLGHVPQTLRSLDVPSDETAKNILAPFALWETPDRSRKIEQIEDITIPLYVRTLRCVLVAQATREVLTSVFGANEDLESSLTRLDIPSEGRTWMLHAATAPQRNARLQKAAEMLLENFVLV